MNFFEFSCYHCHQKVDPTPSNDNYYCECSKLTILRFPTGDMIVIELLNKHEIWLETFTDNPDLNKFILYDMTGGILGAKPLLQFQPIPEDIFKPTLEEMTKYLDTLLTFS